MLMRYKVPALKKNQVSDQTKQKKSGTKARFYPSFCRWEIEAWLTEVKPLSVVWKLTVPEVNGRAETLKFPAFVCPS